MKQDTSRANWLKGGFAGRDPHPSHEQSQNVVCQELNQERRRWERPQRKQETLNGNMETWMGKVEGYACDVHVRTSSAAATRQVRIQQWTHRSRRGLDCKGEGGQAEEEGQLSAPVLKGNRVDLNWNKVSLQDGDRFGGAGHLGS